MYGSTLRGCCGIPLLAEDADIAAVYSAFKLITSPDGRVAREASEHVREVTRRRINQIPSPVEVGAYLSGSNEGVFHEQRGTGVSSVWCWARNASARLAVSCSVDCPSSITYAVCTMRVKRREVMKTIRDSQRCERRRLLIAKKDQGRVMECTALHSASSHFMRNGDFFRFAD